MKLEIRKIDIQDMDWPLSILNCKKEVDQMKAGEQIQILLKDKDVVNNLVTLIDQLSGHRIETRRKDNSYRLIIRKLWQGDGTGHDG